MAEQSRARAVFAREFPATHAAAEHGDRPAIMQRNAFEVGFGLGRKDAELPANISVPAPAAGLGPAGRQVIYKDEFRQILADYRPEAPPGPAPPPAGLPLRPRPGGPRQAAVRPPPPVVPRLGRAADGFGGGGRGKRAAQPVSRRWNAATAAAGRGGARAGGDARRSTRLRASPAGRARPRYRARSGTRWTR